MVASLLCCILSAGSKNTMNGMTMMREFRGLHTAFCWGELFWRLVDR